MLILDQVSKRYPNGHEALSNVSLQIDTGELVFLQMDGDLSPKEFQEAWDYNMDAAMVIHEYCVEALKTGRYPQ